MRILIIGGGGREHAIAWALKKSSSNPEIFVAPGNGGTHQIATNVNLEVTDQDAVFQFVDQNSIDLVIVGPEQPLVDGLTDFLREKNILVVGPSAAAAQLEGSKAFSKAFMERHGIPTAAYRVFASGQWLQAVEFVREEGAPIVVKASGLAAGKGAIVCQTLNEAEDALRSLMLDHALGKAADKVVVESFMVGEEVSVFVLTDGKDYVTLAPAQDHKRIGDGDKGPNTGGMGAYAPAPIMTPELHQRVCTEIVEPTLTGMEKEGYPFQGILYVGLMITPEGPKVVEYNCRLGDPETQVVLPLLKTDAVEVFTVMAENRVGELTISLHEGSAACVVLASGGYPGEYKKGEVISGLDVSDGQHGDIDPIEEEVQIFHAGTGQTADQSFVTTGGRVLGVTARAPTLKASLDLAYQRIEGIQFKGMQFRKDIGQKGLNRR